MEVASQVFSFQEGAYISLSENQMLQKLSRRYPRAFNLRNTLANGTFVKKGEHHGIVYEVSQDNKDHYVKHHYVLFSKGNIVHEICVAQEKAMCISNEGIFFADYLFDGGIAFISPFESGTPVLMCRYRKELDTSMIVEMRSMSHGLYVVTEEIYGKQEGRKRVFYGNHEKDAELLEIPVPTWAAFESWQPSLSGGSAYVSDKTAIFRIVADKNIAPEMVAHAHFNPDIRFGETHTWYPEPHSGFKFLFVRNKYSTRSHYSASGLEISTEIPLSKPGTVIPFGRGFLSVMKNAEQKNNVVFSYWEYKESRWVEERRYATTTAAYNAVRLVSLGHDEILLCIEYQRYVLSRKMVHEMMK